MKVVYIYMGSRGASDDALGMATGLLHNNAEVLCVISEKVDNLGLWEHESEINDNFSILKVNVPNTIKAGIFGLLNLPLFYKLRKIIDTFSPDFVYSYMGHPFERMFVPYLKCKNVLTSIHDSEADHGNRYLLRPFLNFFDYKPRWYVTYSHFSKKGLVERGFKEESIIVTHLACNMKAAKERKDSNLAISGKYLFWGRIEPYKGIGVLLDAVEKVIDGHKESKLIIAGRGSLEQYKEHLAKLKDNVEVYNSWIPNEKVDSFFDEADFVVAPYTAASQSGVVTLAFSYGKPVIASNSGALPEQVEDGVTGLIVPADDSSQLAAAISDLLNDKKRLLEMKKGVLSYVKTLTWKNSAAILLDQIEKKLS